MPYATQSDIENVFGVANVRAWSLLDPESEETTADTARVALALSLAERTIDDRFRRGRYVVPFVGTSAVLTDWCAKIAGVWLYSCRGVNASRDADVEERILWHRRAALEEMDLYLAEQRDLGLSESYNSPTGPTVC